VETARDVIVGWSSKLLAMGARAGDLGITCRFLVEGVGGGAWLFRCRPPVAVTEERENSAVVPDADCTVVVSADDLVLWGAGKLNPQAAVQSGRVRVSGDGSAALRFGFYIDEGR